ncbi:hypothetical protein BJ165DRAFT_1524471 [Panaeolus papilionaceus]|nr:hypothetical protein BJ165DRAFT_1524471 [Panaeolus papilionaceus]
MKITASSVIFASLLAGVQANNNKPPITSSAAATTTFGTVIVNATLTASPTAGYPCIVAGPTPFTTVYAGNYTYNGNYTVTQGNYSSTSASPGFTTSSASQDNENWGKPSFSVTVAPSGPIPTTVPNFNYTVTSSVQIYDPYPTDLPLCPPDWNSTATNFPPSPVPPFTTTLGNNTANATFSAGPNPSAQNLNTGDDKPSGSAVGSAKLSLSMAVLGGSVALASML